MDEGRILGRLEEHKEHTDKRLDKIEKKIDLIQWKILGVSSTISTMIVVLLERIFNR